jgi:hypothetical protein
MQFVTDKAHDWRSSNVQEKGVHAYSEGTATSSTTKHSVSIHLSTPAIRISHFEHVIQVPERSHGTMIKMD